MAKKASAAKKSDAGFLLEKGEKLILAVGIGLTSLLVLMGLMTFTDTADPKKIIADLKSNAERVNREVANDQTGDVDPLPQWVTTPAGLTMVNSADFPLANPPFEPVHQPSMLKENPRVLSPISSQMDVLRFPMRSMDITLTAENETLIGVLTTGPKKETNPEAARNALKTLTRRLDLTKQKKPQSPARPGMPGSPANAAFPQGMSPFGGAPGFFGDGEGDGFGMGMPMNPFGTQRDDRSVTYKTPEEIARGSFTLAETVYPLQAVMIQAAFPMAAQIEEIKRALRLRTAQEAMAAAQAAASQPVTAPIGRMLGAPQPGMSGFEGDPSLGAGGAPGTNPALSVGIQFAGFEVQRQVTTAEGEKLGWEDFNHVDAYFTAIYSRYVAYDPDDPYLTPFLRYDQMMAEPLPQLAEGLGRYPPLRLPQIVKAINDLKASLVVVPNPTEFELRFKGVAGGANPFIPLGQSALGAAFGQPVPPAATRPGFPPPPPGLPTPPGSSPFPNQPGMGPPGMGAPGMPGSTFNMPSVDYTLIRFLDPTVRTGETYEYRIRVKMKNPNFGKTKEVVRKSDASEEILVGQWWPVGDIRDIDGQKQFVTPAAITIPPDDFLFAIDTGKYLEKSEELVKEVGTKALDQGKMKALLETREVADGRRAVVQVQRWLPRVRATGDKTEPVGTWVVAEMPVAAGEYVGKRQLIKLPLWSAASGPNGQYVLRELAGGVRVKGIDDKNQPRGWPVTFRPKPSVLLVDFDGGQVKTRINNREVVEETSTELLLLQPDGKLLVKSSAEDMTDPRRQEREKTWNEWIERVKARRDAPMVDPSGFGGRDGV